MFTTVNSCIIHELFMHDIGIAASTFNPSYIDFFLLKPTDIFFA